MRDMMKGEWKRRNYRTDDAEIIASKKSQATTWDVEPFYENRRLVEDFNERTEDYPILLCERPRR